MTAAGDSGHRKRHRVLATGVLAASASLIIAACGSPTAPGPAGPGSSGTLATLAPPRIDLSAVPARVHVDREQATATWIGPAGGTVAATAADGTTYTLEIPEYALADATPIAMTPISSIDELGLSGGLAGAVYLQPAGTVLAVPASLRITTTRTAPDGMALVGVDVSDNGGLVELVPAAGSGSTITIAVFHFSSPGGAYGTTTDLQAFGIGGGPTTLAGLVSLLVADPATWDTSTRVANALLAQVAWAGSPLSVPGSQGLQHDINSANQDSELLQAVRDWRMFIFVMNLLASRGDVGVALAAGDLYAGGAGSIFDIAYVNGQKALGTQIQRAILGNRNLCQNSKDLHALANMYFWAGLGERYAPAEADWPAEAGGCASLVVDVANLPPNLQAGGSDSLTLAFALKFTDGSKVPADVEATLQAAGFSFAGAGAQVVAKVAGGTTLAAGVFAQQGPPYTLSVSLCWYLEGIRRNKCDAPAGLAFGSSSSAAPASSGSGGSGGPGASGPPPDLSGNYDISGFCNWARDIGDLGRGSGVITQSGNTVTMNWTFSWHRSDGILTCGDDLIANMPGAGSFQGTVVVQPSGAVEIVLPCGHAIHYSRLGTIIGSCTRLLGMDTILRAFWKGP